MPVSTDQLYVMLLGAGESGPNAYTFRVNRSVDDIALGVVRLREIVGVRDFVRVDSRVDDDGEGWALIEVTLEPHADMPAVFGRIAFVFARHLDVLYEETLLFREVVGKDADHPELSFMRLPAYSRHFPGTFDGNADDVPYEAQVIAELEKTLRAG